MDIAYEYEVVQVDVESRSMVVKYTAEGFEDQLVGMRIPYENEALENVVRACSPVNYWISLTFPIVVPEVGVKGTITPQPIPEPTPVVSETAPAPSQGPVVDVEPTTQQSV